MALWQRHQVCDVRQKLISSSLYEAPTESKVTEIPCINFEIKRPQNLVTYKVTERQNESQTHK